MRSYDHVGKHRWTRQFGTSTMDYGFGTAAGASGMYVTGHVNDALPGQIHRGLNDVFLRKYATQ